jgi:cell division septation protein DedD
MAAEKGHRFEFGWLEVLGLIVVFAAGSMVVFFLGIFVGKGLQESRLTREERVVRLPIDGATAESAGRQAAEGEAAAGPAPSPGQEDVRLAVRGPDSRPGSAAALPGATPLPGSLALPTAALEPGRPGPTEMASLTGKSGRWSVQVNATRDAPTAKRLVDSLKARGFDAYDVRVDVRGEVWYRVRVGRYPTMQEATAMVVRLRNEEPNSRAFLVED